MIKQYRISLESKQAGLNASIAYPLYAWLLSQVPTEVGTSKPPVQSISIFFGMLLPIAANGWLTS
mgnify:CR=1 FL=1